MNQMSKSFSFFGNSKYYKNRSSKLHSQGAGLVHNLLHPRPVRSYSKSKGISTRGVSKITKSLLEVYCHSRELICIDICFPITIVQLSPENLSQ